MLGGKCNKEYSLLNIFIFASKPRDQQSLYFVAVWKHKTLLLGVKFYTTMQVELFILDKSTTYLTFNEGYL